MMGHFFQEWRTLQLLSNIWVLSAVLLTGCQTPAVSTGGATTPWVTYTAVQNETVMPKQVTKRQRKDIQQRRYFFWSAAVGVISLLLFGGALALGSRANRPADAADGDMVAVGKQVYDAQCAACHGANLEGEADWQRPGANGLLKAPPHDETGHTWHHDDAYLIESVKLGGTRLPANIGISGMPAYGNILTDEEIVAVLAYIKSAWPPEIRAAQPEG